MLPTTSDYEAVCSSTCHDDQYEKLLQSRREFAATEVLLLCRNKMDGPYDNRILPVMLSILLMLALSVVLGGSIARTFGW